VTGLGIWDTASDFADKDQKREIEAQWLVTPSSDPEKPNWRDYAVCALASGAFPIGLAPRMIGATLGSNFSPDEYKGRRLPIDAIANEPCLSPDWLPTVRDERPFWFTTADGGIIDNDPFEYARFSLKSSGSLAQRIEPALDKVDRAVIMVSPFPELKPIAPEGAPASDIMSIFSALLPALIDQSRFKPSELILAAKIDYASRYLIGPSRVTADGKEQRYGIASGLLGGFGGFVAQAFRDHDFQLGRRNCQQFFRQAFALPDGNPIIKSWQAAGVDITKFQAMRGENDPKIYYCIVPLFGTAKAEVALPAWPHISQARFDALQTRIAERFDAMAPRLLAQNVKGFLGFLLQLPLLPLIRNIPGLIRGKALTFIRLTILSDLVRRDQIEGWELPQVWHLPRDLGNGTTLESDDVRLVLGALLNPAHDGCCNVESLAKTTALTSLQVETALELCQGPEAEGKPFDLRKVLWEHKGNPCKVCEALMQSKDKPFKVWKAPWTKKPPGTNKDSGPLYALASHKPAVHKRVLRQCLSWLSGH
jgi:hypothetical protein